MKEIKIKKLSLYLVVAVCVGWAGLLMVSCATPPCGCDELDDGGIRTGQKMPAGGMEAVISAG